MINPFAILKPGEKAAIALAYLRHADVFGNTHSVEPGTGEAADYGPLERAKAALFVHDIEAIVGLAVHERTQPRFEFPAPTTPASTETPATEPASVTARASDRYRSFPGIGDGGLTITRTGEC
jgi:hypothetical protein